MAEQVISIESHSGTKHVKDYKYGKTSDVCKWYFKIDHFKSKKDHCTDQNRDCRSFTNCSVNITDKQIFDRNRICCKSAVFEFGKCSCTCNGIDTVVSVELVHCEIGHFTCKRNHQETSCSKCRVHKVLTETAEKLFYYDDCKGTAKYRHPQRNLRWHVERKQKACYYCTEIVDGVLFMHQTVIQPLKKNTGCNRHKYNKKCTEAEVPDTKQCGWKQRDHNELHDSAGCHFVPDMGIR